MFDKVRTIGYIIFGVFVVCCFIQTLLTLNPRVTDLEKRMATTEGKVSSIETKIDMVLDQNKSIDLKVEDIYHIILDKHTQR